MLFRSPPPPLLPPPPPAPPGSAARGDIQARQRAPERGVGQELPGCHCIGEASRRPTPNQPTHPPTLPLIITPPRPTSSPHLFATPTHRTSSPHHLITPPRHTSSPQVRIAVIALPGHPHAADVQAPQHLSPHGAARYDWPAWTHVRTPISRHLNQPPPPPPTTPSETFPMMRRSSGQRTPPGGVRTRKTVRRRTEEPSRCAYLDPI